MRDDFDEKTKQILARRVGYRCSNPNCRKLTTGPQEDTTKAISIGVAAHIKAASLGRPRFDPMMSAAERKSPENGIWLCQCCAKLIDSDEKRYSVDLLKAWKKLSEQAALLEIENNLLLSEQAHSIDFVQEFRNDSSGTQINLGNTAIGHQTVYNQQSSEFFDEVEVRNGVRVRTTYRRDPVAGTRIVVRQELA